MFLSNINLKPCISVAHIHVCTFCTYTYVHVHVALKLQGSLVIVQIVSTSIGSEAECAAQFCTNSCCCIVRRVPNILSFLLSIHIFVQYTCVPIVIFFSIMYKNVLVYCLYGPFTHILYMVYAMLHNCIIFYAFVLLIFNRSQNLNNIRKHTMHNIII